MLLSEDLAVVVEVLDNADCPLADFTATVRHLQGEFASLSCAYGAGGKGLHWGARIRFTLAEGDEAYTLQGRVVQIATQTTGGPEAESILNTEFSVKLSECLPVSQRRRFERRSNRFAIEYRVDAALADTAVPEPLWHDGYALDLSAGGMRFRSKEPLCVGQRVTLRLRAEASASHSQKDPVCLRARILRVAPTMPASRAFDVAVKFEALPVADGLRLAHLLT